MTAFARALAARLDKLLECSACHEDTADGFFRCGCCPGCQECRAKTDGVCGAEAASGDRCTHSAAFFKDLRDLPRKLTTCAFCGLEGIEAYCTSPYGPAHACPKVPCRAPGCQGLGAGPHHEATCEIFKDACKAALRGWIKIRHYLCDGRINELADPHKMEDGAALLDLGHLPDVDFDQAAAAADSLLPPAAPAPAPEPRQAGSGKRPRTFEDVDDYSDEDDNDSGADTDSGMKLKLTMSKAGPKTSKPLKKKLKRDPSYQPGARLPAGVTTHRS